MSRILLLVFLSFNISNGLEYESPKYASKISKHYNYDQELREYCIIKETFFILASYSCEGIFALHYFNDQANILILYSKYRFSIPILISDSFWFLSNIL